MPEFTDEEQNAVELLVAVAGQLRQTITFAAKVGISMQVKHPNIQRPTHLDILGTTPMRVGAGSLWVDIETETGVKS